MIPGAPNPNGRTEQDCRRATGPESAWEAHGPHEWRIHHSASDPPEFTYFWCKGLRAHPHVMIGKGERRA